jgi:hypothetical protein
MNSDNEAARASKLPDIKKVNSRIMDSISSSKMSRIGQGIMNMSNNNTSQYSSSTLEQSRRERMKARLESLYGSKNPPGYTSDSKLSLIGSGTTGIGSGVGSGIGSGTSNIRMNNSPSA